MKMTLLEMVQDIPKSTRWYRANKEKVASKTKEKMNTLSGKLTSLITQSRYRAKNKGYTHSIDTSYLKYLFEEQQGLCALSGKTMTIKGTRGTPEYWDSVSIDRIDSSLGYDKGNVQLVCTAVNHMKSDMVEEHFLDLCRRILEKKS